MKPEQFIRWYGIEDAKYLIEQNINCNDFEFSLDGLKRLIDSLETIESWGGIESCKEIVRRATSNQEPPEKSFARKLQMDVANYESIYGGGDE